jgi:hypothetical protein
MYTDEEAYQRYPELRHWFNKLWVSENFGYYCGPSGVAPKKSDFYVVRPIMNLSGMSLGANKVWIKSGDYSKVKPGFFWCEWFEGKHISVEYQWADSWHPIDGWEADIDDEHFFKVKKWTRLSNLPGLPQICDSIHEYGVESINVEFIGKNPIELHLRKTPDPHYDVLIPIWETDKKLIDNYVDLGYNYISAYDDADGFLENPRIGFMVKNNKE